MFSAGKLLQAAWAAHLVSCGETLFQHLLQRDWETPLPVVVPAIRALFSHKIGAASASGLWEAISILL